MGQERPPAGPSVTYFDPDGDTGLLLGSETQRTFVVSSNAMTLVCDAWNRMLSRKGDFKEAKMGDGRIIPLPDDDADGLEILLNIAHLHFDCVPLELDFDDLLAVAVLTDKYGTIRIVRPWIRGWIQATKKLADQPGYEEWLYIAWAFGEAEIFEKLSRRLLLEVHVDKDGQCVTPQGNVLNPSTGYFPPEIIGKAVFPRWQSYGQLKRTVPESILRVRRDTMKFLLSAGYEVLFKYSEVNVAGKVYCKLRQPQCDAMAFGSFNFAMQKAGLAPTTRKPNKSEWSLTELANKMKSLKILTPDPMKTRVGVCSHQGCEFLLRGLLDLVDATLKSPSLVVLNSHKVHMKRMQAEIKGSMPKGLKRKRGQEA